MKLYLRLKHSNNKVIRLIRYVLNTEYKDICCDKQKYDELKKKLDAAETWMKTQYDDMIMERYSNYDTGAYQYRIPTQALRLLFKNPGKLDEGTCITKHHGISSEPDYLDGHPRHNGTKVKHCQCFSEDVECFNKRCWCYYLNRDYFSARDSYNKIKLEYDNYWSNKFANVK